MAGWLDAAGLRIAAAERDWRRSTSRFRARTEGEARMLWSVLKIAGLHRHGRRARLRREWILETPGEVRIAFGSREFFVSPIGFVIGARGARAPRAGGPEADRLPRWRCALPAGRRDRDQPLLLRNRERRGFDALSDGMVALASGDSAARDARRRRKPRSCCSRPDVTRLLTAQAAEINGDRARRSRHYKAMLADDRTRFVGVQGLMRQKLDAATPTPRWRWPRRPSRSSPTTSGCCAPCSICSRRRRTGPGRARR